MQNLWEFLNNLTEADFCNSVNLHIHSNCSDGKLSPEEIIKKAEKSGLKTISITDHNSVQAYSHISQNSASVNLIKGVEFDCWHGTTLLHILGYGIDINNEALNSLCAKTQVGTTLDIVRFFNKRKAKKVIEIIKQAGGIAVLAHPACCWSLNIKKMIKTLKSYGLDGVEVYYPYLRHRGIIKFYTVKKIKQLANDLNMLITGGTDCHDDQLILK